MLIEIWEHLRGYHNWTHTKATVVVSVPSGIDFGKDANKQTVAWDLICKIAWRDQRNLPHEAEFQVFEESPLYQLCDGDTIEIRFNPAKPDQFYLPELIASRLAKAWKLTVYAILFILVLTGFAIAWFGPNIINAFSR